MIGSVPGAAQRHITAAPRQPCDRNRRDVCRRRRSADFTQFANQVEDRHVIVDHMPPRRRRGSAMHHGEQGHQPTTATVDLFLVEFGVLLACVGAPVASADADHLHYHAW